MGLEETVITKANLEGHSIGKYQFKILSTMGGSSVREAVDELEVHYENPNVRDVPVTGSGVHHEAIATKDALMVAVSSLPDF